MREFDFINKYLKPLGDLRDDCAFFDGYCVTKDVLVAGVHFFEHDAPFNLARKSLRVNLSDLAASGAAPFGFMLGLALPKKTEEKWLAEFAAGLKSDIEKYKIQLLGGDTVYHDGKLMISITAIGKCEKPVLRSGARIGDNIFVTGPIGKGYISLQEKIRNQKSEIINYELPEPQLDVNLQKFATAAIDVSDGLLADLWHICRESGVGAELDSSDIPLFDAKADLMAQITGGDDYQLLFTSMEEQIPGCARIGRIIAAKNLFLDRQKIQPAGFEHNSP